MSKTRESVVCWSHLAFPLLFLALAAGPSLAGRTAHASNLIAWIGVGPRMVRDAYVGGNNSPPAYSCQCNQTGSVQCPDYSTCGRTYSSCYSNGPNTNTCVNTGNCNECGGVGNCATTCTGSCSGTGGC